MPKASQSLITSKELSILSRPLDGGGYIRLPNGRSLHVSKDLLKTRLHLFNTWRAISKALSSGKTTFSGAIVLDSVVPWITGPGG